MNRIVVYTCIIGNYDKLLQPKVVDNRFDYICFVRKGDKTSDYLGVWRIEELEYNNTNSIILSRYPKLNPHVVLPKEYDYSLWIDGNIFIAHSDLYNVLFDKINNNIVYSGVKHWGRKCIYDESIGIILGNKATLLDVFPIVKFLIKERFPRNFGLSENNVIFRKHNDVKVMQLDILWWKLFMKFCKRDQMSFGYSLYKSEIEWNYLLPDGYCARNHYYFGISKHLVKRKVKLIRIIKLIYNYISIYIYIVLRVLFGYKKLEIL